MTNRPVPQAAATGALPLPPHMHKGCTRGAQGTVALPVPGSLAGGKPVLRGGEAPAAGSGGVVEDSADGALIQQVAYGAAAV
jgi:hypothetical protein